MTLKKFAGMFKLPITKGIYPYELFNSIEEVRNQKEFPAYTGFRSSLPSSTKEPAHLVELDNLLSENVFDNLGKMLDWFDFPVTEIDEELQNSKSIGIIPQDLKERLINFFRLSPKSYVSQRAEYNNSISSG